MLIKQLLDYSITNTYAYFERPTERLVPEPVEPLVVPAAVVSLVTAAASLPRRLAAHAARLRLSHHPSSSSANITRFRQKIVPV